MHVVVAMQVQQPAGHLAGHALQGQGVGRHGLARPAALQVAFEVTLQEGAMLGGRTVACLTPTAFLHPGGGGPTELQVRSQVEGQQGAKAAGQRAAPTRLPEPAKGGCVLSCPGDQGHLIETILGQSGLSPVCGIWAGQGHTHQGTELHDQQIGCHLSALGQALEQVAVLQGPARATGGP